MPRRRKIDESEELRKVRKEIRAQRKRRKEERTKMTLGRRLAENIRLYSQYVAQRGNITVAYINSDFCSEVVDLLMESITQMLLEGQNVYLDQFGKFEVSVRPSSTVCTIFTGYKPIEVPEVKLVKFRPAKRLKERIRGIVVGKVKKKFGKSGTPTEIAYADYDEDDYESEEGNDAD